MNQAAEGSGENSVSMQASTSSSIDKGPTQSASTTNLQFLINSPGHTSPQYVDVDASSPGPSKRKRKVHIKQDHLESTLQSAQPQNQQYCPHAPKINYQSL